MVVLLCFTLGCGISNAQTTTNASISIKETTNHTSAPLKIVGYSFGNGVDWLKDLTIEVQNVSTKPIYFFSYGMFVYVPTNGQPRPCHLWMYNEDLQIKAQVDKADLTKSNVPVLLPKQVVKLSLPQNSYSWIVQVVEGYSLTKADIKNIGFHLQNVYYGDGTGWAIGHDYGQPISSSAVQDIK